MAGSVTSFICLTFHSFGGVFLSHCDYDPKDYNISNQFYAELIQFWVEFRRHSSIIGRDLAGDIPSADTVPESYLISSNATFSCKSCSSNEVQKLLEKLKTKKASGLDNLPSKMLKTAVGFLALSLAFLFNQSISAGIVPTEWKLARVTPIFKKGERQDVNSYRPISIIRAVAKVFERIFYDQFVKYLNDNDLLVNCQSGFRSLHSTLTSLLEASNN